MRLRPVESTKHRLYFFQIMIGLFNDCFPPVMDGVSVTTSNYAYWLHKKKEPVCVITPADPRAGRKEEYPVYRYLSLPIPMRKPYRLGFPRIDWPFHRRIDRIPFELLHAHCPFSSGMLAMRIAKSRKIPLVATFHSKYKADFTRVIPNKYLIGRLIQNIVRFYEQADEVWIPQPAVEETLREYGYKGKVEVVENGNDFAGSPYSQTLKEEAKKALGVSSGERLLLFVGQHIWEKNVAFLLRSLALLKGLPYKMIFVGTGYAAQELKRMAADLNLQDHVTFAGAVADRERLKAYYLAADLFLFPSLYDNAPLVVREAAALHTPSLLLKDSTASEIITDGINGFVSDPIPEEYACQILRITGAPLYTRQVGECASRTLARSWEDIAAEVSDRYARLKARYDA